MQAPGGSVDPFRSLLAGAAPPATSAEAGHAVPSGAPDGSADHAAAGDTGLAVMKLQAALERTLATYNKDVLGVLEAVTLRLSRVENSVDGLSSQVRSLSATLQQVAEDTGSAAANTQHLRDKQLLIEEQQRLAEVQLSEAKSQVEKLKDVADQAAKATLREFQAQQQQQQQQAEEERAPSPATTAPAPPAPAHPFVPAQAPPLAMAPPYAPPGGPPPPPFGAYGMPPGAPPGYPPVPYPDFHPPQGMVSPPPPPMMDGPPMYGGYGVPPVGSGYAMPQYSPPPPPAPPRGPPPPPPQLSSQSVSVDKVVADVAAMGFSQQEVRNAIATLTAGGSGSVDLNKIIDHLMNGPGSAARQQSYSYNR